MTEQQPLQFSIKPSRLLKQVLIFAHILALLACWLSAVPIAIKLLISSLLVYPLQKIYRNQTVFSRTVNLKNIAQGDWETADLQQAYQAITILPSTVITAWLTVIHYRNTDQKWHSLVVVKDSLSADDYRQLIVKLKVAA